MNLYYVSMEIRVIEELEQVNPTIQLVSKDEEVRQGCRDRKCETGVFRVK